MVILKREQIGNVDLSLTETIQKVGRRGKTKPCYEVKWITHTPAAQDGKTIKMYRHISSLQEAESLYEFRRTQITISELGNVPDAK
jgi:hypothetical protein